MSIDPKARRFPSAAVLQSIISYSRNVMIPVAEALEMKHPNFESLAKEVEEIARMYDARKKAAQSMDFDDLLLNWLTLIEHPQIGEAMSQRRAGLFAVHLAGVCSILTAHRVRQAAANSALWP